MAFPHGSYNIAGNELQCQKLELRHVFHIHQIGVFINCSLESKEPAFLRRLRSEHANGDTSRHERPLARPRKLGDAGKVDDDGPTYVDDQNHEVISKEAYETLVSKAGTAVPESVKPVEPELSETATTGESSKEELIVKETIAAIGGSTKRRLAKVVGDEEEIKEAPHKSGEGTRTPKKGKKGKKIKLSFDDVP